MTGLIWRWDSERGFGWLRADDGQSYFCHASAIDKSQHDLIAPGRRCTFEPTRAPKGLRAERVTLEW